MNAGILRKSPPSLAEVHTGALRVGGFANFSTCDWPGELVATVFAQGCPWDCGYCHNPLLLPVKGENELSWDDILTVLQRRRALLDGVVFSGGEPTLQAALPDAIREIKALGFRVGVHSAGPYPERLAKILPLIDWIGFDVKAPLDSYDRVTGVPGSGVKAYASLDHILGSGVAYEVRTTVHPRLLDLAMIAQLADDLQAHGVNNYALQVFRAEGCRNDDLLTKELFPTADLVSILQGRFSSQCVRAT